jgi:uncharacterized protein
LEAVLVKTIFLKSLYFLLLTILLLSVTYVGRFVGKMFDYSSIDPDGAYMYVSIHHIFQALFVLLLIFIIKRFLPINFNLGLGNRAVGLKYLKLFMLIFLGYTIVTYTIIVLSGGFQAFQYPLTANNIFGYLGFQLLLSGPSEELIFRAFGITLFTYFITKSRINKHLSYATLFTAIIFGLAHVYVAFNPFVVEYSLQQVIYAAVLGFFYADCYEKSKSVIYPMIMHSFTNVVMVGVTIILSFIL